jgi:hypothetical protein
MKRILIPMLVGALAVVLPPRTDAAAVAESINGFGLDLHRRLATGGGNSVASPWSIESALAMTYAGASGQTKAESRPIVLHFPAFKLEPDRIKLLGAGGPPLCFCHPAHSHWRLSVPRPGDRSSIGGAGGGLSVRGQRFNPAEVCWRLEEGHGVPMI